MNRSPLPSATKKWYDLDHPMPGSTTTFAELEEQAARHERNRLEAVAEMLGIIAVMTAQGLLTGWELVTVGGAVFQFGKGQRDLQVVAAHCLPGQIAFNGQPLHTTTDWNPAVIARCQLKPLPLAAKLRNLGGMTDYVTAIVNQADSLIEIMPGDGGLKPAFARAAGRLLRDLVTSRPRDWHIVGAHVGHALEAYRMMAAQACAARIAELGSAVPPPAPESPEAIKARIIQRYLATIRNGAVVPFGTAAFLRLAADLVVRQNGELPAPIG